MSATDHLAKAKDYIAKGEDYYRKAADEIDAAFEENPSLTYTDVGREMGRSRNWVKRLVEARDRFLKTNEEVFQVDHQSGSNKRSEVLRKALSKPEIRRQAIAELDDADLDAVHAAATEAVFDRSRAKRREHDTTPTVGDLMGGEKFEPGESWSDTLVIRLNRNARELASLIDRAGGLLFGSMTPEEAFEYLFEAERLIAEARAAAQEQVRDKTEIV